MARQRSDDRRAAILMAAAEVIATGGLAAPTAAIARAAGVSHGSLFTYFPTKTELLNALFGALKAEMAKAARPPEDAATDPRSRALGMWRGWIDWAARHPGRRRALAQLSVSDEITPESRALGHEAMAEVGAIIDDIRMAGPLRDAPLPFVVALMNAVADTTIVFVVEDPDRADQHRQAGFDAFWRMIA